jgi:CsoR family transcriptional regulator, copper-sensing transcriptional repressor
MTATGQSGTDRTATAAGPVSEPTAPVGAAAPVRRKLHGYSDQKDEHLKRLRRIEGQIRGLQRMVEGDVYCIDILTQVSAGTKALQSFALSLLEEHLKHCVAAAVEQGGPEADDKVAEATAAIARLMRT